jgi:hypothetical protein
MPLSTDIRLPKDHTPRFPPKCIVCHAPPDSAVRIARNSQNPILIFFLPIFWLFGWSKVTVPICRKCKPRFRLQRWGRELILWTLVTVAVFLIMPHFKAWSRLTRKVVVGVLGVVALSPYLLAEVFWPRIFDTTARKRWVDYEFASADYAREFQALNAPYVLRSEVNDA